MPDSGSIEKLESKQRLNQAMEWLDAEPNEKASTAAIIFGVKPLSIRMRQHRKCNDPTIGSYNHYHLSPNGIPRGNQRWYGLVYFIQIAGKPRIGPRELLSSLEVLY